MNSETTPEFWNEYFRLDAGLRKAARKAYAFWIDNHFHPSLRFKCVNSDENIWSVRISKGYRALCVVEDNTAIWFWIGNHDE
ncbi:MAG TPA: hypothetical protein VK612_03655 [Pyrinomonadaceae bacterium]|nr:hypothetical protein [Pyrinomonadaceae bacterium]